MPYIPPEVVEKAREMDFHRSLLRRRAIFLLYKVYMEARQSKELELKKL